MDALWYPVLSTIFVILMKFETSKGISYVSMNKYCGSRITVYGDHQLRLYFSDDGECEVTIETTNTFPMVMLYFESFYVSCILGSVSIRNEQGQPLNGLTNDLCGYVSSNKVYTHNGGVKIKYTSEKRYSNRRYGRFVLIVTLYSDSSSCTSSGHVCDNGRCIDANLRCNGYNSCGDNSGCWHNSNGFDYSQGSASGVGIGVGLTIGVIFIIIVTVIGCKRRYVGTSGHRNRTTATSPPMQVVYATQANPNQFDQGFSHELYGVQMHETTANYQQPPPVYDQPPPQYNPEWAPKEMKPESQDSVLPDHTAQAACQKTVETRGHTTQGDTHVNDKLAVENSDDHYSTLDDATLPANQRW